MMRWVLAAAASAVSAAVLVLMVLVLRSSGEVRVSIDRLHQELREQRMGSETMTSEWTSGGVLRTYTTTQREGESQAEHAARHSAGYAAMVQQFPVD